MIGKLKGTVDFIDIDHIILDVGGVGYIIHCSGKLNDSLIVGEISELLIQTIVREGEVTLFGFANMEEKRFFNSLLRVQGVGAKLAIVIISSITTDDVSYALTTGDMQIFSNISGVGKKIAARIMNELKDKKLFTISSEINVSKGTTKQNFLLSDAVSALTNLGYNHNNVVKIVENNISNIPNGSLEEIIKESLKILNKKL